MKKNIILVDIKVKKDWEFVQGVENETNLKWSVISWNNAGLKTSRFFNVKRILGYMHHAFTIFQHRKEFNKIIAWQQFYGIFFAFFLSLFHVKKVNELTVMTFIYKNKNGTLGKIYKWFIVKTLTSGYIDHIVVFSSTEASYYADILGVDRSLFQFIPLGIDSKIVSGKSKISVKKPFLLSVGRSNRDYNFLMQCKPNIPMELYILTDVLNLEDQKIPEGTHIINNIRGEEYLRLLKESYAVLIPLKDKNISSGQLVILQSMHYGKPIIITEAYTIHDYVENNKTALICDKNVDEFCAAVNRVVSDNRLYQQLSVNEKRAFVENYTLKRLGEAIGKLFVNR